VTTSTPPSRPEQRQQNFELVRTTVGSYFDQKLSSEQSQWNDAIRDVSAEVRWTNLEYQKLIDSVANGFATFYKVGEKVAVMLGVNSDTLVTFLSAAKAGVQPTFLDADISVPRLQLFVKADESKGLVFAGTYNLKDHEHKVLKFCHEIQYWPVGFIPRYTEFPSLKYIHQTGNPENEWGGRFFQLYQPVTWPPILPVISKQLTPSSDLYSIIDDQGKRIVFSHFSVLNNGRSVAHVLGLHRDRVASFVPFHTYGAVVGGLSCLESDSLLLFPTHDLILRDDVLSVLHTEHTSVVVSPLKDLVELVEAKTFEKTALSRLRKVVVVVDGLEANELSLSKLQKVQSGFKVDQLDVLVGVREGGIFLHGSFSPSSNSLSVSPLPHISVRVSATGQIQFQGYNLAHKFVDEKTSVKSSDGWFSTGINSKQLNNSQFQIQLQQ